jgi:capsid assembly protease
MNAEDWIKLFAFENGVSLLAIHETRAGYLGNLEAAEAHAARAPQGLAIIPLQGPLRPRGISGMEGFSARLAVAAANPDIAAIILDVDTPGGTVAKSTETAAAVRAAAQIKPVIAMVDSLGASAGYWIISGASQIVLTPSAEVGSLGVISAHLDFSERMAKDGVKPTVFRSVPWKAEGSPFEALTPEAIVNIEGQVAEAHKVFIGDVATGRRASIDRVNADFGQGRMVTAARAVQLGMADKVGTMADVIAGFRSGANVRRRRSAAVFAV